MPTNDLNQAAELKRECLQDIDRKLLLRLQILTEQSEIEASDRVRGFIEGQVHAIRMCRQMIPVDRR